MWPTWVLTVASESAGEAIFSCYRGWSSSSSGMTVSNHPLVILVRPGMKVRPVHFQTVVARPEGQQVMLAGV